MTRLSIIIPTLNEAHALPGLLDRLQAQSRPPDEVIVADAGSHDGTAALASARGARVVPGGRPGPGRNAGARAASAELLLFLDADVSPPPDFIERLLTGFARERADVATSLIAPSDDNVTHKIVAEVCNLYLQIVEPFSPHAPGFCILIRRELHEAIGGFNEAVVLAEDFDYVQRAARRGVFQLLTDVRIPVSLRRLEKEGLTRLAFKHLWGEMYALAGKPMYWAPYDYEFGAFGPGSAAPARRWIDVEQLREQLGRLENPLQRLSEQGRAQLAALAQADWLDQVRDRLPDRFDTPDADTLRRYVRRRLAMLRLSSRLLKNTLARLPSTPPNGMSRLLERRPWRPSPDQRKQT